MELELFKCQPEALFLMANCLLSFDEFLLFQFDPLLVKPDTVLDIYQVSMEVLQEDDLFLMRNSCSIKFLAYVRQLEPRPTRAVPQNAPA